LVLQESWGFGPEGTIGMPRKTGNKTGEIRKGGIVQKGVKVTAVKSQRGPPSTTVNVELNSDEMKEDVGNFGKVTQVSARIPEGGPDAVRWREERMTKFSDGPSVQRFSSTHYGASDSHELGVGVKIETEAGTLNAQKKGEAYAVRETDKPEANEKIGKAKRRT
jgi:hypothetical protein